MSKIEIHTKLKVHRGQLDAFRQHAAAVQLAAQQMGPALVRSDWFFHEAQQEGVWMAVYADEGALLTHLRQAGHDHAALRGCGDMALDILGVPSNGVRAALAGMHPRIFEFAEGFQHDRAAGPVVATHSVPGSIEIFTRFQIHLGQWDAFKQAASVLATVVRAKDKGTWRYDWYYDETHHQCIAMDTYADSQGMFAHMRTAHDAHEKLLHLSTMTTEFLGDLPADALAAVSKYDPYIARPMAW